MGNNAKDLLLAAKARDLLIYREKRREKQYRCIEAKRRRQFAMQAGYSRPGVPPWSE